MAKKDHIAKAITHAEVGDRRIVAEMAGNNRYIVVTEDIVFVGSKGIASGAFFGTKVKRYPIDSITSVDVRKTLLLVEFEIALSGGSEIGSTVSGFSSRATSENITFFQKELYADVQQLAGIIFDLQQRRKNKQATPQIQNINHQVSIPEQIKQLAELRDSGILTEQEFQEKKAVLMSRL